MIFILVYAYNDKREDKKIKRLILNNNYYCV